MYLKKIEIQGFKSLADKIEMQFNPGISAIVGPNGSGKSNIADAVRWVLGEQSAKSLRGAKMEDVIFAGSEKRKAVGMAEVSLTLDNSTAVFPSDYAEISVTRRVYRSGDSEYFINKTPCRLKDIHELFMDTGIGREGYSIIGQGKIEEILNARSEERRVIIEEAAGIVKYKSRKQQAVKKLHDTQQNLVRISDIINELETQVGPLEEQSQQAVQYLDYKSELDDLEINLIINQVEDQKEKLTELTAKDENLNTQYIERETLLRNLESGVEEHKLAISKFDEEIMSVQADIYNQGSLMEKNEGEVKVARERCKGLDERKQNLLQEIAESHDKEYGERNRHQDDEKALTLLREKIGSEQQELDRLEQQLYKIENQLADDHRKIEEKKADIIDLLNDIAGVRNSITSGENEQHNLSRRNGQLVEQGQALLTDLEKTVGKNRELTGQLETMQNRFDKLTASESDNQLKKEELSHRIDHLSATADKTRRLLQEETSRLKALSDLQKGYEGYYRGVKEILIAGRNGQCQGICGVVAETIRVSREYETAVEVALGGALQFIITESDDSARKAIEYLKKTKGGRATFLPLNTIKHSKDVDTKKWRNQQGFMGLASEIVECDVRFRPIIDYLLAKVIVVDNIKNAVELARNSTHNIKIVTLEGDVINPGGAMTGGVYHKGATSLLGRVREIEETGSRIEARKRELEETENNISVLQNTLNDYINKLKGLQEQMQALHIERSSTLKDLEVVGQEKSRLESALSLNTDEQEGLQDEIKNSGCRINNLRKRLEELEALDNETRDSIAQQQQLLTHQEKQRSQLTEQLTQIKISLAGLRQEEANYAQIMDRVLEAIGEMVLQTKKKEEQVTEIKTQNELLMQEIEDLERQNITLGLEKGTKEDYLNKLKNEKQALTSEVMSCEGRIKTAVKEMTQIKEQVHASDVKRARLEIEVENLLGKLAEELRVTYEEALLRKTELKNRRETVSRIKDLKEAIASLGAVNLGAIEEFERVKERYEFLRGQYSDLEQAKDSLYQVISEMDRIMTRKFSEAFSEINASFGEVFNRFFGGGKAELVLTDNENLLESGIEIVAQPPGKKPQHLSLLSGGEKALTAISLLFAILRTKPSPFCVLDEIEAALDDANVDRFAAYMKEFAQNSQFIIITHRKGTMESANVLYGVTMDDSSVTKMVSMKLTDRTEKVS